MPQIINNPPVLFHFIKFMKAQGSLKVLQFCLSLGMKIFDLFQVLCICVLETFYFIDVLDDFNKRILVPTLTHQDKEKLIEEVCFCLAEIVRYKS